jgi:hypothetical protein
MRAFLFGLALSTLIAAPALACGTVAKGGAQLPPIGADLDAHLAKAQPSEADLAKVRDLRAKIETLVAEKKIGEAFRTETEAMGILGYKRVLSRCGPSSWSKVS